MDKFQEEVEFCNEALQDALKKENLMEMANLAPDETGFKHYIWCGPSGTKHGYRIKVVNETGRLDSDDFFSLSITDNPEVIAGESKISAKELNKIKKWIIKNKDLLIKHANRQVDDKRFRKLVENTELEKKISP